MSELKTDRVNGFMVVRVPHLNRDLEGRGAFPETAPCLAETCYGGIDRMPWFEIDELWYKGVLPEDIAQVRDLIQKANADFSDIYLCGDLELSITLLEYSKSI